MFVGINKELIKSEIIRLKKEKNAVILAHNYQSAEIQELADYVADSLELARASVRTPQNTIVFCGVRFMAETAKILSPEKKILLPVMEAGCPLADTIDSFELMKLKQQHPDAWVVSYVNSSADVKALSDACCTSSNAVAVVRNVPTKKIIFVPDKNLGYWVQKNVPEKQLIIWQGFCYVHEQFTLSDLRKAKELHTYAEVIVHPECRQEVVDAADFVLSTSGMIKQVAASSATTFIIGTEEGIIYRLQKDYPAKEFYSLGCSKTCMNMKKTTLKEVYRALNESIHEINLNRDVIEKSSQALERMVQYG